MRSPLNMTTRSMFFSLNYMLDTPDVRALLSSDPMLATFIPKLEHLRERIERLYSDAGPVPSPEEEKRLRRENAALDRTHDQLVRILHDLLVLTGRLVDEKSSEELEGLLDVVLPSGVSLSRRRYVEEAAAALLLEETLKRPGVEETLAAISIGFKDNKKSALGLARELIEAGQKLHYNLMVLSGEEVERDPNERREVRLRFVQLVKLMESTMKMVWENYPEKQKLVLSAYHGELKSLASSRRESDPAEASEQPDTATTADGGE